MKRQWVVFAVASLAAVQAQATVVFNWVQTGTPSPTNQSLPFSLAISDSVYNTARSSPVTFGAYSARIGVEQDSSNYVRVPSMSSDLSAAIRVISQSNGASQLVPLAIGLSICNSPPYFSVICRVGFVSSAVQPNDTFNQFFNWGGGLAFANGMQNSSFTLSGNALTTNYTFMRSFGDGATITTDSLGAGNFALLTDGSPTQLRGTGYWQVDTNTIPVPLPPSAWMMGLGLAAVALRVRRG